MRVGMLTGSVSRQGGGVFDSVRGLSLALREHEGVDVHVFGLADEDTERDRAGPRAPNARTPPGAVRRAAESAACAAAPCDTATRADSAR